MGTPERPPPPQVAQHELLMAAAKKGTVPPFLSFDFYWVGVVLERESVFRVNL